MIAVLFTEVQHEPGFARDYRAEFVKPRRTQGRGILGRAIEFGEIAAETTIEVSLDLLHGPIYPVACCHR